MRGPGSAGSWRGHIPQGICALNVQALFFAKVVFRNEVSSWETPKASPVTGWRKGEECGHWLHPCRMQPLVWGSAFTHQLLVFCRRSCGGKGP